MPAESRRPRQAVLALGLTLTWLLFATSASSDQASDAYKAGKELLKNGQTLAALREFQSAVSLKPDSSRYREALAKTTELLLDESAQRAASLAANDYLALADLSDLCSQLRPDDPRTSVVRKAFLEERERIEAEMTKARSLAIAGDLTGAQSLLQPLRGYRDRLPGLTAAEDELTFRTHLDEARSLANSGNFKSALEAVRSAQAMRPADPDAAAVFTTVAEQLVTRMRPLIAERKSSGLSGLGTSILATQEVARICPVCETQLPSVKELRAEFENRAAALLKQISQTQTRAAAWALCGAAAEARVVLGTSPLIDSYCLAPQKVEGLRVGVALRAPPDCTSQTLLSTIESSLPVGSVVIPLTFAGGSSSQPVDLSISIEIEACPQRNLGDADIRSQTSSYRAGTQQLVNSEYIQIETDLRNAQAEQARLQRLTQANPNDLGAALGAAAVAIRIGTLSRRLRQTQPFLEQPVDVPYTYEEYKAGVSASYEGTLTFSDSVDSHVSRLIPLQVSHSVWQPGIRGVYPSDSRGLKNRTPALPPADELFRVARTELEAQVASKTKDFVPVWLAAKASTLIASKKPSDAHGYLTLLRISNLPENDPDLTRYVQEYLRTLLQSPAEIEAQRVPLSAFEKRLTSSSGDSASAISVKRTEGLLETALKAVVIVRCGDSQGTGFLISASGFVLTNQHVLCNSKAIEVETSAGESFLAKVVSESNDRDLALLQVRASGLPFLRLASSEEAHVGDEVFALGNPRGLQGTVTKGIVSAKRHLEGIRLIQIDAPINPGNSGGPLLLGDGRVIGINSLKLRDSEGLNFAISADEAKTVFGELLLR